jgi:hypothetical protein
LTELANGAHSDERAGHDLGRTTPIDGVGGLGLEELRVGQHDAELIIEAVIERQQLVVVRRLVGLRADTRGRHALRVGSGRSA